MTTTKPEFPVSVGQAIGYRGQRCSVVLIPGPHNHAYRKLYGGDVILIQYNETSLREWVSIFDLTDPPTLPDRITEHVPALAEFLGNQRSIFDEETP